MKEDKTFIKSGRVRSQYHNDRAWHKENQRFLDSYMIDKALLVIIK